MPHNRISLFTALLIATPALAADIPRYDVTGYCRNVSDISGGSAMIFNGCIEMEQESYDALKATWSRLPDRARAYCDQVAQVSGGSYSILEGCIEMEAEATGSPPAFKY